MHRSTVFHSRAVLVVLRLIFNNKSSEKVTDKTLIPPPDWEALISVIADEILAERSPARLLQVRARLYDLLTHCIPPTTVLKVSRQTSYHFKYFY